ncbi:MAG: vitamin B12 dependent-methionine synthase activation domain-containing protein, partial [Clostridia bacterium]
PVHALAAQAVGTAAIESWCDLLCRRFAEREAERGRSLRPRFSPGYGDFPLEMQKDIFRFLDCSRKIGVSLTESLLMVPGKSVSALVGISLAAAPCTAAGCSLCEQTECEFRRT